RRLLLLAALGLAPAAMATFWPPGFALALVYLAVCVGAAAAEFLFGVRPAQLEVRRRVEPRWSLGERETVELTVRNFSRWPMRVHIQDTPPEAWEATGLPGRAALGANQETVVAYEALPTSRGRFHFGDLFLR